MGAGPGGLRRPGAGLHHLSLQVESLEQVREVEETVRRLGAELIYERTPVHFDGAESDVVARREEEQPRVSLPETEVGSVLDAGHADIVGGIQGYRETAFRRDDRRRGDRRHLVGEIERRGPRDPSEALLPPPITYALFPMLLWSSRG